jgi:hypothetical protein
MYEQVAWYVRCLAIAENPKASSDTRRLATQLMPPLGLTHDGMVKNGWAIADAVDPDQAPEATVEVDGDTVRDRLQLVMGGQS